MREALDIAVGYGAALSTVCSGDDRVSQEGEGGGLSDSVDRRGVEPLAGILWKEAGIDRIELADSDVILTLERNGVGASLTVSWASGESFTEQVELAPHAGVEDNRPGFLPDAGGRIHDLVEAVHGDGPVYVVDGGEGLRAYSSGRFSDATGSMPLVGSVPATAQLGPASFRTLHGVRANYVAGAMAGGISSVALVQAMGHAGLLAFYGAGGLPLSAAEDAISKLSRSMGDRPFGANLLHNPVEPAMEQKTVDLFLLYGVRYVSASAFMGLTPAVAHYRYKGIHQVDGRTVCPNRLFAKVSRPEVAEHFLRPAPAKLLAELVGEGKLTEAEAELAVHHPMADAVTAEADSGGHTDRRALPVLLPILRRQRDRIALELAYGERGIHVALGAAGGIGTPESILAAYAMGADYVLTGSVNQCTPEAGTSDVAKEMLLAAGMADVASGPAPDMFELGAHVQVLSRGTMYAKRGDQLYAVYKGYDDWYSVPEKTRAKIEKQMLGRKFDEVWSDCVDYWSERDIGVIERADTDGRHKMALVFRWYLGMSSRWARMGDTKRKRDFQIWCGPSMGSFNDWVAGTDLEPLQARGVVAVADALLGGAASLERVRRLAAQGVELPLDAWRVSP
ncbi:MAG: PfaD family polyunsaturated fatty acid/polyketide biosynthesis protein [Proteobacteria bacterium]|nr:PfaD family polyunsaturated fatty acid/polyketide biosynthesis protein [Pseudomonadota bacterium]MCP4918000.1 PfaD family polyunsaturated fatty acid/polyketide biosynthesis protein [Pseudomonadota bacterium]